MARGGPSPWMQWRKAEEPLEDFEVLGPSECPLSKISANYRYQIILRAESIKTIQSATARFIYNYKNKQGVYIEVDVDPTNLL